MADEILPTGSPSISRIEREQDQSSLVADNINAFKEEATRIFFNSVLDAHQQHAKPVSVPMEPPKKKKAQRPKTVLKRAVKSRLKTTVTDEAIPLEYKETYVTLSPKDPHCIYAYWEVNGDDVARLKAQVGSDADQGVYTLRVYDVTYIDFNGQNANYWFDLDELHMNNRYIPVLADDAVYCAEIGIRLPDQRFLVLARSNCVATPRSKLSHRNDLIWKDSLKQQNPVYVNVRYLNRQMRGKMASRANWQMNTARKTLNFQDIALYYAHNKQLARQLMGKMDAASFNLANKYITVESSVIPLFHKLASKDRRQSVSSDEFILKEKNEKTFPLAIDMTVTVNGRTEPGAQVFLGNDPVEVREDGTFTLTWPLHEGCIPVSIKAVSTAKKMGKSASTAVFRSGTDHQDLEI